MSVISLTLKLMRRERFKEKNHCASGSNYMDVFHFFHFCSFTLTTKPAPFMPAPRHGASES